MSLLQSSDAIESLLKTFSIGIWVVPLERCTTFKVCQYRRVTEKGFTLLFFILTYLGKSNFRQSLLKVGWQPELGGPLIGMPNIWWNSNQNDVCKINILKYLF